MKDKIVKLLSIKSLVTLTLTGVFAYLALREIIDREQFMTVYVTIIAFYFGTQAVKE